MAEHSYSDPPGEGGDSGEAVAGEEVSTAARASLTAVAEGMHAAYGETKRFRHNNMEDLERLLTLVRDNRAARPVKNSPAVA